MSTALIDGKILAQEFRLILSEISKYQEMKDEIRIRTPKAHASVVLDEATKSSLIQRGGEYAMASFIKKVGFTITFICHCVSMAEEDRPSMYTT